MNSPPLAASAELSGEAGLPQTVKQYIAGQGASAVEVAVDGPLTVNDADLAAAAALEGVGLAYVLDPRVLELVAAGRLVRVLKAWCPPFPGFYLYHPSRRQTPAALRAFVAMLRREALSAKPNSGVASGVFIV